MVLFKITELILYHLFCCYECKIVLLGLLQKRLVFLPFTILGKTGYCWSTVVVNGTRHIPNGNFHVDALLRFISMISLIYWKIGDYPSGKAWN